MSQTRRGKPQSSISVRFPPEVLEFLDVLMEHRIAKTSVEGQPPPRLYRADVLSWLLERVSVPVAPSNDLERRLVSTHINAFGPKKGTS